MSLNLQNINKGIYFEFYLNDNLFFRYNYNPEELEITMFSLCEYITKDIFKHYKYKKFTGTKYYCRTILWFSMLVNQKPIVADVDQSVTVSNAYPLDIHLSQQAFSVNLYMNILVLLCNEIESESYLDELEKWKIHLQRHSSNLLWNSFPNYNSVFQNIMTNFINKREEEIKRDQASQQLNNTLIEDVIKQLSSEIELWQEHSYYVLSCFDIVSIQYQKCIRFAKYSKGCISLNTINKYLAISNIKNDVYLNYIYGNFNLLSTEHFSDVNKMMALKLFMPKSKNLDVALKYLYYMQNQIVLMQSKKSEIVKRIYSLQEQAIDIWKKCQIGN